MNNEILQTRPSWEQHFMAHAELAAKRSTCIRMQTGAVLVKHNRVISEGYNGVASEEQHCSEYWKEFVYDKDQGYDEGKFHEFLRSDEFRKRHHQWSKENELHGEQNAIMYASKRGIKTNKADMYTVYSPCIQCAKVIASAGIKRVYYKLRYKRDTEGIALQFLRRNNIAVYIVDDDGNITNG